MPIGVADGRHGSEHTPRKEALLLLRCEAWPDGINGVVYWEERQDRDSREQGDGFL